MRKHIQHALIYASLLLSSCQTLPFGSNSRPTSEPEPLPPQPEITDPIELLIEGDHSRELAEQSHIKPFVVIIVVVLLMCFVPLLYSKARPHVATVREWAKTKWQEIKKKKLDTKDKE